MDNFLSCVGFVLEQEGGFVNNPADPGGATNFGVTLEGLSDWRGYQCTADDVRTMDRAEATDIYKANYWLPSTAGEMPAGLDLMVFDFGVDHGPASSVRMLQHIIGAEQDGIIGPDTLHRADGSQAVILARINALGQSQLAYYASLHNPTFGKGWAARTGRRSAAARAMAVAARTPKPHTTGA